MVQFVFYRRECTNLLLIFSTGYTQYPGYIFARALIEIFQRLDVDVAGDDNVPKGKPSHHARNLTHRRRRRHHHRREF